MMIKKMSGHRAALTALGLAALAGALVSAPAFAADGAAADRIKADVAYLADDARAGRYTGSAEYEDAARYVADRFAEIGLKPAGTEGWFQKIPMRFYWRDLDAARLSLSKAGAAPVNFVHLEDYLIEAVPAATFEVTAPTVFVGYGVTDPESGYDDYAGVDARGKIVVYFSDAPRTFHTEKRAHYGNLQAKLETAAAHGAVGAISIPTASTERRQPWNLALRYATRPTLTWLHPDGRPDSPTPQPLPRAAASAKGGEKLFDGAAKSFAELRALEDEGEGSVSSFDLPGTVTIRGASRAENISSSNVAGVMEGSDPRLKKEFIVLSAHLDGVGVDEDKGDGADIVKNGALDNAMGIAAMIEAARALKKDGAPKRSVVFLAVTGEEIGLRGADYYAHYPTVPKKDIAANVNLDMPLVLFDFVDVIAFGAERSDVGDIVREAAAGMNIALTPDPIPEEGIFTRSDHYRFVRQGIPSVFIVVGFGNGGGELFADFTKNHYHKPTDDLNLPINYEAAARFAELNFRISRELANASKRPEWKEGDFFGELFGR